MSDEFDQSGPNSNDYKYNESIKNAFLLKKEKVSKLLEEQLNDKPFIKEIIIEALSKIDTVYDSFVLSYKDTYIQIYEKNIVKDVLDSYLAELRDIQLKLNSILPSNELQLSKLQGEIERIEKILEWNQNKF